MHVCRLATGQERTVGGSSGAGSIWHRLSLCATSQLQLILAGEDAVAWQPGCYMIHVCTGRYRCMCIRSWEWKRTDRASAVSRNQWRYQRMVPNYRVPFGDTPVAWQLPTPITHTRTRLDFLSPSSLTGAWVSVNYIFSVKLETGRVIMSSGAVARTRQKAIFCPSPLSEFSKSVFVIMDLRARNKVEMSATTFLSSAPSQLCRFPRNLSYLIRHS